jgi:hypothetical protein
VPRLETLILRNDTALLKCYMPKLRTLKIVIPQETFLITLVPKTVEILEIAAQEVRGVSTAPPSFSLRNLTHLVIKILGNLTQSVIQSTLIDDFWPRLDLPNLQELTIWKVTIYHKNFLGYKGVFGVLPSLTDLTFGCMSQPLTEDFSTTPRLRFLGIIECPRAKNTLSRLVDDGAVLPDLQKLHLDQLTCRALNRFEWRCKGVRPNLNIVIE